MTKERICKNCGQTLDSLYHMFDKDILELRDFVVEAERLGDFKRVKSLRQYLDQKMDYAASFGYNGHIFNPETNLEYLERRGIENNL